MLLYKLMNKFLIGSCRYQDNFKYFFPPRLHTTKEILNYLNNYDNLNLDYKYSNVIYGDWNHFMVIDKMNEYLNNYNLIFKNIDTVYIEISSKKNYIYDGHYLNYFYVEKKNIDKSNMEYVNLTYDEMFKDLKKIKKICLKKFNFKKIIVITHVNLKLKKTNAYIKSRNDLVNILIQICKELDIEIIVPEKKILKIYDNIFLEDVLYDGLHWNVKNANFPKLIIDD